LLEIKIVEKKSQLKNSIFQNIPQVITENLSEAKYFIKKSRDKSRFNLSDSGEHPCSNYK